MKTQTNWPNRSRIEERQDATGGDELPVEQIVAAVRSIKYGYVQVIVQDSRVVQIDKTEKIRLKTD